MDNLDSILDSVKTEEQRRLEALAEQKTEEQRRIAKEARAREEKKRYENAVREVCNAINKDDLQLLTQAVVENQHKGILPEDFLQTLPEKEYITYYVKSAKIADFLLSQIDTETEIGARFSAKMIDHAVNVENVPVDEMLKVAGKYNVSLKNTAKHGDKEVVLKCIAAGMNVQDYDFARGAAIHYAYKYGVDENDRIHHDPDPKKAAEQKELLVAVLKEGYKIDVEKIKNSNKPEDLQVYDFLKEIAHDREVEQKFATLTAEDKKLVDLLKKGKEGYEVVNTDKAREAIGDGLMKQDVYEYMMMLESEERSDFMKYYRALMGGAHAVVAAQKAAKEYTGSEVLRPRSRLKDYVPPKSLDEAERAILADENVAMYDINNMMKQRSHCREEIKNKLGEKMFRDLDDPNKTRVSIIDKYTGNKRLLAEYLVEHFEEKMKEIESKGTSPVKFLRLCLEVDSKNSDYPSSQGLKKALLKYRTSGALAERRAKAGFFKEALKSGYVEKDRGNFDFHMAVSNVSYTPASSLNKYTRMVKTDENLAKKCEKAFAKRNSQSR